MIGALIAGKYKVKRLLGEGGMGAVYEGEHVEIGKRVAIKVIGRDHGQSEEHAARFKREARAASAVESEHIVQVFDVGRDDQVGLYMVMEFLAGQDLGARLEACGGKIAVEEAMTIGVQAARALAKAHAAGVVHRDLKPPNLYLTAREDGSVCVKILDFGISKLVRPDEKGASLLTREGAVMGTPVYMSPEQAQGLAVDARSDVWSLGAALYEILAGRTPFEQKDTYEQMIIQIVTQRPKPLLEVAPWVPAAVAAVIDRTLVHDVADRMPDAATLARELAAAAKMRTPSDPGLAAAATELGAPPVRVAAGTGTGVVVGARTKLDAGIPPNRTPLVAIGGVALAAIGVVAFIATRTPEPKPASGGIVAQPLDPTVTASTPVISLSITPIASTAPAVSVSATNTAAPPKPVVRPVTPPAVPSVKPQTPPTTNYGGAGTSTAY